MSEKNDKELYLNFDEYLRQGNPQKKERAEAWRVAIGLQAVDGLKVSGYLLEPYYDILDFHVEGAMLYFRAKKR